MIDGDCILFKNVYLLILMVREHLLSFLPSGYLCVHVRVSNKPSTTASTPWTEAEEEEAGAFDGPV